MCIYQFNIRYNGFHQTEAFCSNFPVFKFIPSLTHGLWVFDWLQLSSLGIVSGAACYSCTCEPQHPPWELTHVLPVHFRPIYLQFGQQQQEVQRIGSLHSRVRWGRSSWPPAADQLNSDHEGHMGSESTTERMSVSLLLSVKICLSDKGKKFLKRIKEVFQPEQI